LQSTAPRPQEEWSRAHPTTAHNPPVFRYAMRRLLWAIPTLFGISLVVFFLTSLIPDPAGDDATRAVLLARDPSAFDGVEEQRRQRFLDLPRFFNTRPNDVRSYAADAVQHLVANDGEAAFAAHRLQRLGGAALPHVLPKLDNLPPAARGRVAVALAPIADRMGVGERIELDDPNQAAIFWTHFWEDRALEFTEPSARRAVNRLVRHATELREKDLQEIDTYALPEVMAALAETQDRDAQSRLTAVAAHATGRSVVIPENATADFARRVVADWQEWWYVHRADYVALTGAERVTATATETRYGKWIARAATGQLGVSVRDGEPVIDKLRSRAPVTFALTGLAMLSSYLIAIPVAVISAWRRGHVSDYLIALVLFALYSMPTVWVAEIFARSAASSRGAPGTTHLFLPVVALTISSLASLSRYQRTALLDVLGLDYVRTARAKGLPEWRVLTMHALRNAVMPTVTLAGLQLPQLLGGAFIVEEVFGLPGLGYESLRAVEAHDSAWLIATILTTAVVATLGLIVSDVAYGILDPRVRELVTQRQKRSP
jgi:peptide/nickel transport system permease protein